MAGILVKQNVLALKRNEQPSDMVMASPFEDVPQNQGQQQGGYQQPQQQGGFQRDSQQQGPNGQGYYKNQ